MAGYAHHPDMESLAQIASSDKPSAEWPVLRDLIKHKLAENIALFLTESPQPPPAPFAAVSLPYGGLKLPPFPPRTAQKVNVNDPPVSYMSEQEAHSMKDEIYSLLDGFESNPPFTIQRLCELCVKPKQHYKSVGKYLRAVEKSLLVTSTWDAFPVSTDTAKTSIKPAPAPSILTNSSLPTTPLFSPIPFLHNDARRSQSRSPPPSPLALASSAPAIAAVIPSNDTKAIGLVDELDDPSPGHLSDHPTALSSVTSLPPLEARFTSAKSTEDGDKTEDFSMDEDKENAKA